MRVIQRVNLLRDSARFTVSLENLITVGIDLDEDTQVKLEEQLDTQIKSVLSKIDEESELRQTE